MPKASKNFTCCEIFSSQLLPSVCKAQHRTSNCNKSGCSWGRPWSCCHGSFHRKRVFLLRASCSNIQRARRHIQSCLDPRDLSSQDLDRQTTEGKVLCSVFSRSESMSPGQSWRRSWVFSAGCTSQIQSKSTSPFPLLSVPRQMLSWLKVYHLLI